MAGRVTHGRFANYKIEADSRRQVLYIKGNDEFIELTPENVKNYKFTDRPSMLIDRICYCIQWKDGSKSIIAIPSTYKSFLISGCETGPVPVSESNWLEKLAVALAVFASICVIALIVVLINKNNERNKELEQNQPSGTWSEWSGIGDKPNASMLVETTDTVKIDENSGAVGGYFINNSNQTYRHLEAVYGAYDNKSGVKIGRCTFSTNDVVLEPNEKQGFTAVCNVWGERMRVKLESVGFKAQPLK